MIDFVRGLITAWAARRRGVMAGLPFAVLLVLAGLTGIPASAAADDAALPVAAETSGTARLADGIAAWDAGDYAAAAAILKPLADAGNPQAQERMAVLYIRGLGVTTNDDLANHYLHLAADAGNAAAQQSLGTRYLEGFGINKDVAKGILYLEKASANGLLMAQLILGSHYYFSEKNFTKARPHLEQASIAGDSSAQQILGTMFINPHVGGQQLDIGLMWLRIADLKGKTEQQEQYKRVITSLKKQMPLAKYLTLRAQTEVRARSCIESGYQDCGWEERK